MRFEPGKTYTHRETLGPAMEIEDPDEARTYFADLVSWMGTHGHTRDEATQITRSNLGYFAGYYSAETQARVLRVFGIEHPFVEGAVRI